MSDAVSEQPAPSAGELWQCVAFIRRDDGSYWPCLVFSNMEELYQYRKSNAIIIPAKREREFMELRVKELVEDTAGTGRMAVLLGATATPLIVWERAATPLPLQTLEEFLCGTRPPISEDLKNALRIVREFFNVGDPSDPVTLPSSTTVASATAKRTDIGIAVPDDDDERKLPATVLLPDAVTQALTTTAAGVLDISRNEVRQNSEAASTVAQTANANDAALPTAATEEEDSMDVGDNDMEVEDDPAPAPEPAQLSTKKKRGNEKLTTPAATPQGSRKKPPKRAKGQPSPPPQQDDADVESDDSPPQLYGTDVEFNDVKAIFKKGGYKFDKKKGFSVPHQGLFKTEQEFRTQLCQGYVSCKCEGTKDVSPGAKITCTCWDSEELKKLHSYIRYDILQDTEYRRQGHGPEWLNGTEIAKLLTCLGVHVEKSSASRFTFPGEHTEVGWKGIGQLDSPLELKNQVARFQWPSCCDFSKISEAERFNLEFMIVQECRVNTLYVKPFVSGDSTHNMCPSAPNQKKNSAGKHDARARHRTPPLLPAKPKSRQGPKLLLPGQRRVQRSHPEKQRPPRAPRRL